MELKKNSIVTLDLNSKGSNTYLIDSIYDEVVFLNHPLFPECLIKKNISQINKVGATIKNSSERLLDFININKELIDHVDQVDLESLCMYFVIKRELTPKQKQILANLGGNIASVKLDNNVNKAMKLIRENSILLDDFNLMWYKNFKNLFKGIQSITSVKQKSAIFNMAGFILAELNNPISTK